LRRGRSKRSRYKTGASTAKHWGALHWIDLRRRAHLSAAALSERVMSAPWKRAKPKPNSPATKLTPQSKARAKAAAARAGRRYPNLVDNMNAARKQREAASKSSKAAL